MNSITIYMAPTACSRVAMVALEEAGLDYETRALDLTAGAQLGSDYLALNRKGKVPSLAIDGQVLTENAAILAFLDQRFPEAKLLPRYDDPIAQTRCLSDLFWCASTLHPQVRQIRAPFKWTLGDQAGVREDGLQKFAIECAFIGERVATGGWWYGTHWSILDTYLYWAYSTAEIGGFPVNDYPELVAHAGRVRARPAFRRMLAREETAVARHPAAAL